MRVIIVVSVIAIALLVTLGLRKNHVAEVSTAAPLHAVVAESPKPKVAETLATPEIVAVPHQKTSAPPRAAPSTAAPLSLKEVLRERDLAQIETSPAKDTLEAKQVEDVLAAHGFERAALPAAYSYAYEFHRMSRLMGYDQSEGARFHLEGVMRHHRERLERYGQLDDGFPTHLLSIQPKVFYGQQSTGGEMRILPKEFNTPMRTCGPGRV